MEALLNIGVRAALRAGDIIVRHVERLHQVEVSTKGRNDFVSDVDRMAEADIIETVRRSYPDHAFLAEESGVSGDNEHVWIIDPLDGTTNFLHGFPVFAVSIALQIRGRLEHGVIYDPMRQELFTASRGQRAELDGKRIRVSGRSALDGALVGTGFPYRSNHNMNAYIGMFRKVSDRVAGIRRTGSAALDFAYVAAGRLDAFWELGLSPWDMAAGTLLVREAGGLVADIGGNENFMETGNVVAGAPKVFTGLLGAIGPYTQAVTEKA